MRLITVPCRTDNYAYLIVCESTKTAVVVDPSESPPVVEALEREGVGLAAIWNTHHHHDHVKGNKGLLDRFPEAQVVAHEQDRGKVPGQNRFVSDGAIVEAGEEVRATVIHNPGHTMGAISYYLPDEEILFTGDTLFAAGCGRLFEGTPQQMQESLRRLVDLPESTRIYCGHEYTLSNLRFARLVEPNNTKISERLEEVAEQRDRGESTMGFQVRDELATNVFVRVGEPDVRASLATEEPPADNTPVEAFAALRRWKDRF